MNMKEILKGIIIGIAKIIPGLSGAVLMISFNLYDKAIYAITNFFDNPKKNFQFLFNLSFGIIIGIVFFSNILNYFITNYYAYTTSLFIGLILGGIPIIFENVNKSRLDYVIIIVSFIVMVLLSISNISNNYFLKNNYIDIIVFFVSGLLEALGTILPGISSTALLMLMGVYNIYINTLSNLFDMTNIINNLRIIFPFSVGLLSGIIFISLLVNYLFKYYRSFTFSLILGVSLSSLTLLFIKILSSVYNLQVFIVSILFIVLGYLITSKI